MNTENLYIDGTDIDKDVATLNAAKYVLDNMPLWDSTGAQIYDKTKIQQKLI